MQVICVWQSIALSLPFAFYIIIVPEITTVTDLGYCDLQIYDIFPVHRLQISNAYDK